MYQTFIIHSWERRKALKIQQSSSKSLPDIDKDGMDVCVLFSAGSLMDKDACILLAHIHLCLCPCTDRHFKNEHGRKNVNIQQLKIILSEKGFYQNRL